MQRHELTNFSLPNSFSAVQSELRISGLPISGLIENFGTPHYVYDANVIRDAYQSLVVNLPWFKIFYSIKANPNLAICSLLRSLNAGAEIASSGELKLALETGYSPDRIIYAGPAKTDGELSLAIRTGIASINVESFSELSRIDRIAKTEGQQANVSLRINALNAEVSTPEVMAGGPSRFGIDEEIVFSEMDISKFTNIKIIGIHVYTASQILDNEAILRNLRRTLRFADLLSQKYELPMQKIIFGGGFGVPYSQSEKDIDLRLLSREMRSIFESQNATRNGEASSVILELGRFLVAQSGVYITKVIDVKESRGKTYVATDGGINHFTRPVITNQNHPTFILNRLGDYEERVVDIGGPICTPIDIIAKGIEVPNVQIGDIIGIFNTGAYGYSMSCLDFLSHPKPAEVLVDNNTAYLIRERSDFEDVIARQSIPEHFLKS